MERCPNCHARWDGGETCRRCGMDLRHLLRIEQQAERSLAAAVAHWSSGDQDGALQAAATALLLQRSDLAAALHGFIASQSVVEVLTARTAADTAGRRRALGWLPWGQAADEVPDEYNGFALPTADTDEASAVDPAERGARGRDRER